MGSEEKLICRVGPKGTLKKDKTTLMAMRTPPMVTTEVFLISCADNLTVCIIFSKKMTSLIIGDSPHKEKTPCVATECG